MKQFRRGLVVGKFSPLHRGHEHLLNAASAECDELVIIAYNNPEFPGCEPEKQRRWFRELFPEAHTIVLDDLNVREFLAECSEFAEVPPEAMPAEIHRRFVAEVYAYSIGRPLDAIFTSESYGPGFVEAMNEYFRAATALPAGVVHREVDRDRAAVPISATMIRARVHELRAYLSPAVYADFVRRVCFLGAESTGKSTLAEACAARFETAFAAEYGRELWVEKGGGLELSDMPLIAARHVAGEERAAREAARYLFVDTSPLTTLFYSLAMFGEAPAELSRAAERRYDVTFLCMPDIPFVQDSTRQDEAFRMKQHEWYLRELPLRGVRYVELSGTLEARMDVIEKVLRNPLSY